MFLFRIGYETPAFGLTIEKCKIIKKASIADSRHKLVLNSLHPSGRLHCLYFFVTDTMLY